MGSHFALVADSRPITRNLQIAFGADSDETVDAFQRAARAAGHTENGAYVLDPAGASVEVVTATGG
jgi:catechol 2,3-dioxygenase-like lactoylglutathione lyase family enzyme